MPEGKIQGLEKLGDLPPNFKRFGQCMTLCNESKLFIEKGRVQRSGLPTEAALKVLVEKMGNYDKNFKPRPVLEAVE